MSEQDLLRTGIALSESFVRTPRFRISFPALFEPQSMDGSDGPPRYSITMLFDKATTDLTLIRALLQRACATKWGANVPRLDTVGLRDGSEKSHLEGYDDSVIFGTASSQRKPLVVDAMRNLVSDPATVVPGSYAVAAVNAFAYDYRGLKKGCSLSLQSVQLLGGGEAFGDFSQLNPDTAFALYDMQPVNGQQTATPTYDINHW